MVRRCSSHNKPSYTENQRDIALLKREQEREKSKNKTRKIAEVGSHGMVKIRGGKVALMC